MKVLVACEESQAVFFATHHIGGNNEMFLSQ